MIANKAENKSSSCILKINKYAICTKNGAKPSYIPELIGLSLEPKNNFVINFASHFKTE